MIRKAIAVTGYVLAGGRSSRMGRDKALLEFGGMTLVERAVSKLKEVVAEVRILSATKSLEAYGRLVPDRRTDCGPLGGLEAALQDCGTDWVLLLPVDMPLLPAGLLRWWIDRVIANERVRIAMLRADGKMHPALLIVHREVAPSLTQALDEGERKVELVLRSIAKEAADRMAVSADEVLSILEIDEESIASMGEAGIPLRLVGEDRVKTWFANVNTPAEFEAAEGRLSLFGDRDQ